MPTSTTSRMTDVDGWLWPLLHRHAPLRPTSLCPSLRAFHAEDEIPLWEAVEARVGHAVAAPFYAVAWPGAQALARALQDGLLATDGCHVLDLGCGSGLAAVAAAKSGIARVTAADVDPLALSACRAMAQAHGVPIGTVQCGLPVGCTEAQTSATLANTGLFDDVDVLLVGDLVYDRALGSALRHTLATVAQRWPRIRTLVADSGRPFFAKSVASDWPLRLQATHSVPVPISVEGCHCRQVRVYEAGRAPVRATLPHGG